MQPRNVGRRSPTCPFSATTRGLKPVADAIIRAVGLPPRAAEDASHLATATLAGLDYLLTWNFRHLANEHHIRRLRPLLADMGLRMTTITDPQRLSGGNADADENP